MRSRLCPIDIAHELEDAEIIIRTHERGVGFQILVKRFDATVKTLDVVEWFGERSYDGSMAALFTWVLLARPVGCFATIPSETDFLWKRPDRTDLYTPCYRSDGATGEIYLESVNGFWSHIWTFVAFRACG
ncbi:MAG: hypothetical protein ABIK13_01875 [Patescibacteria group bacterium]